MKISQRHDTFRYEDATTVEELNQMLRAFVNLHNTNVNKSNDAYASIEAQSKVQSKDILTQAAANAAAAGGGAAAKDPPAQSVTITTLVDQNIPFLSPVPVKYQIKAWFIGNDGSTADIIVSDTDQFGSYFVLRANQLSVLGTLHYQVLRNA